MDEREFRLARLLLVAQFGISVIVLVACMIELTNARIGFDQAAVSLIVFVTGVWLGRTPGLIHRGLWRRD